MNAFDPSLDPQRTEPALSEREQAVRDVFVSEYLKDFDAYRACIRMGFLAAFAVDQAKAFMQDGYILRKIDYMTRQAVLDPESDKQAMLANLRWLAHNGTPASRASATKLYMEAKGYIEKDGSSEELMAAKLIDALKDFADNAPA
jgi:hypothetical protein